MKNLCEIFSKNGINLNKNQEMAFEKYFEHLIEENKKFNLTAITDEDEVCVKHFLDSVVPQNLFDQNAKVVDVGSGAGFPAIPLKIVRDDLQFVLVDSLQKRVKFLEESKKLLNLQNVECVHSRVEDFAAKNREMFNIATARAVAPLCTLVEYLLPLVKVGGKAIIYKSTKLEEELSFAQKAISVLGGKVSEIQHFNFSNMQRTVLVISKIKSTPAKYPRSQNKPKTHPIS